MIYLDHNATTPTARPVVSAMLLELEGGWANASSQHAPGQASRRRLAAYRAEIARLLGAKPAELIFTSGATESNHLALNGLLAAAPPGRRRLVLSAVEHAGQMKLAQALQARGVPVTILPVQPDGVLDLAAARALIGQDAALVSLMAANNETGALMPVPEVAAMAHAAGAMMHVDATQWIGKLPFDFAASGADTVALSAHKLRGPKGVGALLLRSGVSLHAQLPGSQERGRRGGTENLPAIAGFAAALQGLEGLRAEAGRQAALRDHLERGLSRALPATHVFAGAVPRLPGTSCLRVGRLPAEVVLQRLERLGVAASSGAACSAGGSEPSHVLTAMGVPPDEALAAVRLSLGETTNAADIDHLLTQLPPLLTPLLDEAQPPRSPLTPSTGAPT